MLGVLNGFFRTATLTEKTTQSREERVRLISHPEETAAANARDELGRHFHMHYGNW